MHAHDVCTGSQHAVCNTSEYSFSVCSHVHLLNYRSELAQQDTDTIHDHNHTKKISMQVRSAIMGRNGRVVWGAYFQMVVQIKHKYKLDHYYPNLGP